MYSRFGKSNYDAAEKFNPENFSQLIRTCNIKKLLQNLPGDSRQTYSNTLVSVKDYRREDFSYHHRYVSQTAPPQRCYYQPKTSSDQTLVFESRFESGNL